MTNDSKLGLEIKIIDNLFIRTGLNKNDFTFGFGLQLKNIDLDYAYINNNSEIFTNNHSVGFNINLDN